ATGLVYMQQRYYDPILGVFLSVDPINAYNNPVGQYHRYRYANNNPYKFIDPDGREAGFIYHPDGRMTNHFVENQSTLSNAAEGAKIGLVIIGIGASFLVPDPSDLLIAGVAGRMAFGMKAYRGWDDAAKYMRSVSREFGPTSGSPGTRTLQGFSDGGRDGAEKMFAK